MEKITIFTLLLLGVCWSTQGLTPVARMTANLADLVLKSTYSLDDNSQQLNLCFQKYTPKINELAEQYEQSLNACVNASKQAEAALREELQPDLDNIQNITQSMCANFDQCQSTTLDVYDILECYNNVSGSNMQSTFSVQNISKGKMEYVKIDEEYIQYNETQCNDKCTEVYTEDSAAVFSDLSNCIQGKAPVTTIAPATNAPETEAPATTDAATTTGKTEVTDQLNSDAPQTF